MTRTVHVLAYGRVLCGSIHGLPCDWGPQHRWVSWFDGGWHDATCSVCREVAEMLGASRAVRVLGRYPVKEAE